MIFKKFLLSILTSLVLLLSFAPYVPVQAQASWFNPSFGEFVDKVYDDSNPSEIFGERYTAAQVQWIFWSIGSLFISIGTLGHAKIATCGTDINCWKTAMEKIIETVKTIKEWTKPTGSITSPSTLAGVIGRSPISGINYTKDLISKFNPVAEVSAQGFGFTTGGNAVLALWRVSRNICFALMTLIIIIFAFMIMFRMKINPQTVISLQSAIPKLFGALILITFSYALAGFAIDLMYVIIGILASFISGSGLSEHTAVELFDSFTVGESAIGLVFEFWLWFMVSAFWSIFSAWNLATFVGGILLFIFSVFVVLVCIIFTIKILVLTFKTFANVVLTIVTGPFEILLGTVIPGMGFGSWFKKLMGHLVVYPLMGIMFFLAFFFLAQSLNTGLFGELAAFFDWEALKLFPFNPTLSSAITDNSWDPPLTVLAVSGDSILWAIVGYVIFTMIPKTVEIVQGLISGRPFGFGSAVGEATGALWANTGAQVWEAVTKSQGVKINEDLEKRVSTLIDRIKRALPGSKQV